MRCTAYSICQNIGQLCLLCIGFLAEVLTKLFCFNQRGRLCKFFQFSWYINSNSWKNNKIIACLQIYIHISKTMKPLRLLKEYLIHGKEGYIWPFPTWADLYFNISHFLSQKHIKIHLMALIWNNNYAYGLKAYHFATKGYIFIQKTSILLNIYVMGKSLIRCCSSLMNSFWKQL